MRSKNSISWKVLLCIFLAGIAGVWLGRYLQPPYPQPLPRPIAERIPQQPTALPRPSVSELEAGTGKLAFVIDDWGYNLNNLPLMNKIRVPMTLAILPHLRYSSKIASKLGGQNFEIILHMPMETYDPRIRQEKNTLYTTMSDEEIKLTLDNAIADIPFLRGASNHMGSKATEDRRVMKVVLERLQEENLYFLDSLVTSHSIAEEMGREVGVRFTKRTIFLDNQLDKDYIRTQIQKMAEQARRQGYAIGIGHDRPITLGVIQEMIPELKEKGYQFVYVSQLVEPISSAGRDSSLEKQLTSHAS